MKVNESVKPAVKTRRKLLAGMGILSAFSLWKATGLFFKKKQVIACAPPEEKKTMKVLSQDGRLVEVDVSKIKILKGKISDQELQDWIKK
jgi:hypothetical protein